MAFRHKLLRWALPLLGAALATAPVVVRPQAVPGDAWTSAAICRELLSGSTEGRQALVASAWYAPMPTLLQLPFEAVAEQFRDDGEAGPGKACPFSSAAVVFCAWLVAFAALYRRGNTAAQGGNLAGDAFSGCVVVALAMLAAWGMPPITPRIAVPAAAAICSAAALVRWVRRRALADWVPLAASLAALALCGVQWIALLAGFLAIILLLVVALPAARHRAQGLLFLLLLPVLYAGGVWLVLSYAILDDPLYAWRFLTRPAQTEPPASDFVKRPFHVGASPRPDFDMLGNVERDIAAMTPYGRVFVCGYEGLPLLHGSPRSKAEGMPAFTPCLDLHLPMLRRAYARQRLFLLVPRPDREVALEGFGDLYANGAHGLLFADDYGAWRLYELISAPLAEELEDWRKGH